MYSFVRSLMQQLQSCLEASFIVQQIMLFHLCPWITFVILLQIVKCCVIKFTAGLGKAGKQPFDDGCDLPVTCISW